MDSVRPSEIIIYYDKYYPTSWLLNNVSEEICNSIKLNFSYAEIKNADELSNWMKNKIDQQQDLSESIIIFSKDIVPDTIHLTTNPNSLVRTYLENGGNILWMGDIPLYYLGHNDNSGLPNKELLNISGIFYTLGILQISIENPRSPTKILNEFEDDFRIITSSNLEHKWFGIRPILSERKGGLLSDTTIKKIGEIEESYSTKLAYSPNTFFGPPDNEKEVFSIQVGPIAISFNNSLKRHLIRLKTEIYLLVIFILVVWLFSNIILNSYKLLFYNLSLYINKLPFFDILPSILTVVTSISLLILFYRRYYVVNKKYVNAWIKYFNKGRFIRIWDYPIYEINKSMKKDLNNIIKFILHIKNEDKEM